MNILKQHILRTRIETPGEVKEGIVSGCYCFPAEFIGFSGHFPGYPILPAYMQIMLALNLIEEHHGSPLELSTVERAKFYIEIRPGQEVFVECRESATGMKPAFEAKLTVAEGCASSFLMTFTERNERIP